ncbi:MAG: choline kinase [Colwelliaceae bacterium]|nr:choline kinase [Colwelliaceae bacterium]
MMIERLKNLLNDDSLVLKENVQTLWSGYGQIVRVFSQSRSTNFIVKAIAPDKNISHPRGWQSATGHERKLISYQVELAFYENYAALCTANCRVADLIAVEKTSKDTLLVLEDLDAAGFKLRYEDGNDKTLFAAIKWLANFHALFMFNSGASLWPIGSYWHLATRPDEWHNMPDNEYKRSAEVIDLALNNARYKTLIHGDAKFANLCFHENEQDVAAVDFQYVGVGSPVKDLMYLLGSCLDDKQLFEYSDKAVNFYLSSLKNALSTNKLFDLQEWQNLEQEFWKLYPVAWADFYRFLIGWNPDSWKICNFMAQQAELGLTHAMAQA